MSDIEDLRRQLSAMHRRAQKAEALVNARLDALSPGGLGRSAANYAASRWKLEAGALSQGLAGMTDACAAEERERKAAEADVEALRVDRDAALERLASEVAETARLRATLAEAEASRQRHADALLEGDDG